MNTQGTEASVFSAHPSNTRRSGRWQCFGCRGIGVNLPGFLALVAPYAAGVIGHQLPIWAYLTNGEH